MIDQLLTIAEAAGKEIMTVYERNDFSGIVDFKADNSPLTLADTKSHQVIEAGLQEHFPQIPILSEEGKEIPYQTRKNWNTFWLVDPLDGTKEFIKRNGDFTVNIALIEENVPVLGVIYAPTHDLMYVGVKGEGAFKQVGVQIETREKMRVNEKKEDLIAVVSRSHATAQDEQILETYKIAQKVSVGSSLKFCLVAEGKADLYFRSGPTMEWDTGAGQAILEAAGGQMHKIDGQPFTYNKNSLLNSGFLCTGWRS